MRSGAFQSESNKKLQLHQETSLPQHFSDLHNFAAEFTVFISILRAKKVNMSMTRFCPVTIHCFVPGAMFRKCYMRVHLNSAKLHTSRKLHKNWLQHFKMQWLAWCARRIISYFFGRFASFSIKRYIFAW